MLDDLGLVQALEWLTEDFTKRTGILCTFAPAGDITLKGDRATTVFRIVQETLTNVTRHISASRVQVDLQASGGEVVLEVEDNGKVIPDSILAGTKSLGLLGMQERARVFDGRVDVQRIGEASGTVVRLWMPVGANGD